jgi:hypothetical protein
MLKNNVEWALCGDYSINKVYMKGRPSIKLFIIYIRGKNINSTKNDQDWDF